MAQEWEEDRVYIPPGPKRVLVVGAGAAGMSAAYLLSQRPDKFQVTLIDAVDYCGGQAFSIPLDKERYGASWCNQGVQGGSYIFHHTLTMFNRQGYQADPVNLQVSFGKDDTFWSNVFPTELLVRHQAEVKRFVTLLKILRWFEIFFALLPLRLVFKMFFFSDEFINTIALPMTALFLGTGNATPEVPAVMFERLCTSPTYGMWYPPNKDTIVENQPPMVVFPKLSEFYETWKQDLISRGVTVRLSTELEEIVERDRHGVLVQLKSLRPNTGLQHFIGHYPAREVFHEVIMCTLPDKARTILGWEGTFMERRVLGAARFSDDLTITHNDSDYMLKHYENFYRDDLAVSKVNGTDQTQRLSEAATGFRPMYYIKTYADDPSKLEMCFDTTNYQSQFPENVPFEQHVFQTIFLNKKRDKKLWSRREIRKSKIIRKDWWHQLCHSWTHYVFVVPWVMFLQGRKHVRFAGSWTLVNAHEVAIISGLAAAVDLGAEYPEDLENDKFAFLCFRLYYLLAYGKWYRRNWTMNQKTPTTQLGKEGASWATGPHGGVYKGPGVSTQERRTWRDEMKKGTSTGNLAEGNAPGRSQP